MFGRSMFRDMAQDDFFAGHSQHMRHMEQMMGNQFSSMGMLEGRNDRDVGRRQRDDNRQGRTNELFPFGQNQDFGFGNMFGNMDKMMADMDHAFVQASQNGDGHSFQQSSVMTYSKTGEGAPKVYQASTATKRGPGGVRETRKALRDSEREMEKMSVGRHINDRGHEIEKHCNTRSGQIDEMQNYHNIDEKNANVFDREWQEKSRSAFRGLEHADRPIARHGRDRSELRDRPREERRERQRQRALPDPRSSQTGKSEHWGRSEEDLGRDRS